MKKPLFVLLSVVLTTSAIAQLDIEEWESFSFRTKLIKPEQLKDYDDATLSQMRGIVFGKHGRVFKDWDIQNWLVETTWYKENKRFSNAMLNEMERKNLDIIREAESKLHKHIEPGDMRFWRTKIFTKDQVGEKTIIDLHIMLAEIEAIHGRTFPEEPQIQKYFEERYWYKAARKYNPKTLTPTETKNIATLHAMEKEKRKLGIQPGDMQAFQNRLVSEAVLENLSLHELRLLRNEVYALRGHKFKTKWLADMYANYEWYKPLRTVKLNNYEQRNVAMILKRETQIHEDVSKKPIDESILEGLWLEDVQKLRNEIYARHGKTFSSKWTQGYFQSFPWYKPNKKYSEKLLTPTEKANLKVIFAYESTAQSQFNLAEG